MTQYEIYDHAQKTRLKARNRLVRNGVFYLTTKGENNIFITISPTSKLNKVYTIHGGHNKSLKVT